jgi:hypothetical protein
MRLPVYASLFRIPFKIRLLPPCAPLPSALGLASSSGRVHIGVLPAGGAAIYTAISKRQLQTSPVDLAIFRSHPQRGLSCVF